MIIPSIDIMNSNAVQLIEGKHKAIDAGDPLPIARSFARTGEIAIIDLDAALSQGSNKELIRSLLSIAPCRVGGGIRDAATAIEWLDAGASKVILGTAASPEILSKLPRDRVIAALDARDGNVVVEGWTKTTNTSVEERILELRELVSGFLVTFVEREGHMTGLPLGRIERLVELAKPARLTVAGGVRSPEDIAIADQIGADTQVGMALYTNTFDLADGFCAPLNSDRPDKLWPTIIANQHSTTLGLAYSNIDSVRESLNSAQGVYFSRSRQSLWRKGASSGNTQDLLSIRADCDRDTLLFTVRQRGAGFCHTGSDSCFGKLSGIQALQSTLSERLIAPTPNSYSKRLMDDPALLRDKLHEEADELIESLSPDDAAWEAADLIYFTLTAATSKGASLEEIETQLDTRARAVSRRSANNSQATSIKP
ncbi:MAG: phosphoribosyl-ATP diphosphatase [Planctomycetota bacterium]